MQICEPVLQSFRAGRVFKPERLDDECQINSISFHRTHDLLVAARNDDSIQVYDTCDGRELATLHSKKYGVANVSFSHDPNCAIYSSTKGGSHAWRYHDLALNKYVRYFEGHTGRVTTLCQSPKTDQILSAAEDKQVRLWDLRSGMCTAVLQAPGLPTVAWDEQGLVFCVGAESGVVKLYDACGFSSGPFSSFVVSEESNSSAVFSSLRFSLDGKSLLAVVEGRIHVLDAFQGNTLRSVHSGVPEGGAALEASLTADGKFIISGCGDRHIRAWSVDTGLEVATWTQHEDIPTCLKFSPRKMLVASGCKSLCFWVPDPKLLQQQQQQWHV